MQIHNNYFNELEDFGRYVFLLGISFVEAYIFFNYSINCRIAPIITEKI